VCHGDVFNLLLYAVCTELLSVHHTVVQKVS
jgi:hypothetical protein